jgi:hypothetical protein
MVAAKSEMLINANLPYGHDVAKMAKGVNFLAESALFALFAFSIYPKIRSADFSLPYSCGLKSALRGFSDRL